MENVVTVVKCMNTSVLLHSMNRERSAMSGFAPSVPGSVVARRATRQAVKALAQETLNPGPTTSPACMH